ncbi:MAG TPA: transcriptional regulator, partial [Phycisphaerales bacterium]|nr:transcriptional regulator [Phycisphaerales bacterium]
MKLSDTAEEILETLWISQEEKGNVETSLKKIALDGNAIAELTKIGYISVEN